MSNISKCGSIYPVQLVHVFNIAFKCRLMISEITGILRLDKGVIVTTQLYHYESMGFVRWKRCGCLSSCLHLVSSKKYIQCLVWCWSEVRRWGSGYFQGHLQPPKHILFASRVFFSFFPTTEGKQMRCNVNSRLLMQHCAKMCAPAAWTRTERRTRPPLHPARRAASFREI